MNQAFNYDEYDDDDDGEYDDDKFANTGNADGSAIQVQNNQADDYEDDQDDYEEDFDQSKNSPNNTSNLPKKLKMSLESD